MKPEAPVSSTPLSGVVSRKSPASCGRDRRSPSPAAASRCRTPGRRSARPSPTRPRTMRCVDVVHLGVVRQRLVAVGEAFGHVQHACRCPPSARRRTTGRGRGSGAAGRRRRRRSRRACSARLRFGVRRLLVVHAAQRALAWLKPTLSCTMFGLSPCCANSSRHQARAKKPRSSSILFSRREGAGEWCGGELHGALQADAFVTATLALSNARRPSTNTTLASRRCRSMPGSVANSFHGVTTTITASASAMRSIEAVAVVHARHPGRPSAPRASATGIVRRHDGALVEQLAHDRKRRALAHVARPGLERQAEHRDPHARQVRPVLLAAARRSGAAAPR